MLRLRIDRRRLGAIAAALVGLGLAGLATRDVWMAWRWAREARASLTATEAAAIARCEDPGPAGTARLLASDAPVACSPAHVAAWVGAARTRRGFAAWLRRHEAEASPGPRWRAHVGLARWYVDAEAPVELAALLGATALTPEAREWTVRAVADGELAGRWVDPVLRLRGVATRVARGDLSNLPDVALALGAAGAAPGLLDDVDTDALFDVLERRVGPAAASDLPAPSCAPGPACAAAWAEAVRALVAAEAEGWDGGGAEIDPGPVATGQAGAPWEALWAAAGQPEDDADARRLLLAEVVAWVGGQERPDAALAAALASPYAAYGVEQALAGEVGDPAAVLGRRRGSPWATALAGLAVGRGAGVEVQARPAGDGVELRLGSVIARVGPCGGAAEGPAGDPLGEAAVLARAALEAAGGAVRRGDDAAAGGLLALAEAADPQLAVGAATARSASELPGADLGRRLGGVAPPSAGWRAWLDGWTAATSCPPAVRAAGDPSG